MTERYLGARKVTLPSRSPLFVEPGHCQWCNKPLTGRSKFYCKSIKTWDYGYYSECRESFLAWWTSRPAYVRATFIRDNFTCQECGLHPMREDKPWLPDISRLECDHIIPLARGGQTEMGNLQTLCTVCNRKKGTKVDGEKKNYPKVIPSRDGSKCPDCRARGYRVLPWQPPDGYDPLMKKVECIVCSGESYICPLPYGKIKRVKVLV